MTAAIFVGVPFDSADSSHVTDSFSFDFEMPAINWLLFSFAILIVARKFAGPPNAIPLGADEGLRAVNVNAHPVAVTTDSDTVVE